MKRASWCLLVLIALPSFAMAADLSINNAWDHAKVMVYELPEADGRAEAVRYVESVRDQFMKGGEVLDAAAADESSLKGKLKEGFVLYTTLGEKSKLLRLATRKLGWFPELAATTGERRLILAGKNPYSKGYCVIYAATSNHALTGINEVFHGPSSYYVFQGRQLLREGTYDEHFISIEHVSKAAALKDVNQFFTTLHRVHPNLLRNVSEDGYRKLKEQTAAGVTGKVDSKGEIAVEELASLLYYAAAYFKDGHTSVHWQTSLNEWNTRGRRFPAFRLAFDNGHFVIASVKDRRIVNMELVGINGTPVLEFLRPILDRCSGEMLAFRAARFIGNEPFWYYLTNLFGGPGEYMLKVRDAEGQEREMALETLNFTEYQAHTEPFRPNTQGTKGLSVN